MKLNSVTPYRKLDLPKSDSALFNFDLESLSWQAPANNLKKNYFEDVNYFIVYSERPQLYQYDTGSLIYKLVMAEAIKLEHYFNARAKMCTLNLLPTFGKITEHTDPVEFFGSHHRVHLPIVTNKNTSMTIDQHEFHMEPGYYYEIDNMRPHTAKNEGNASRIHLIIDLLPNN
jgi:hypothetical protein